MSASRVSVKNIRLTLEYDGTDFCGWQKQPGVRTVEGELLKVLAGLVGFEPEIIAAARTDSGVHALGQVVNFSSNSSMEPSEMEGALNSLLPPDVRVLEASLVPLPFNARFDARLRVYRYEIADRPSAVWRKHRWQVKWRLNVEAMEEAIGSLAGEHDFSAYTYKDEERSPWIVMEEARVRRTESQSVELVFRANRFLRRMVRLITGTLVEVGRGKLGTAEVEEILRSRDPNRAGPCAPPHGLYLVGVGY